MKKTTLTLFFALFVALTSLAQAKYHRVKILGTTAKSVCDYYSGSLVVSGTRKINFYGLSSKLNVGSLYYTNSKYYIVTQATDVYEQDADDDWTVSAQPTPITSYQCKKYIRVARLGSTYTEANRNFCTNRVLENIKANYYWTGTLSVGNVYIIDNEYYKVTSISNTSNQDADENWFGTHHSSAINFACKRFHKLGRVSSPCSNYISRTYKLNLENLSSKLTVGKSYRINGTYYKVISSSDFQDQDADDDLFVSNLVGPYSCRISTNDLTNSEITSTPIQIVVFNMLGKKVKEYKANSMNEIKTEGLGKGLYILKSTAGTKKILIK
ncbi:T9SS type A sorting domain-containing protein [Tenacibaculum sp. ZS6-P6]|uniref:T9SS type A sorting domain-containing protein n=1 Tax=Tenacibaculum sp. ZS6-P6 TaxID=3447503 RepID=UPI003F9D1AFB